MITDPIFYLAAFPGVIIVGLSKGGFGPGTSLLAIPLLTMVIPPLQAAAIMLPILCVMDLAGLWGYRGKWSRRVMAVILPGALLGIGIGTLAADYVDDAAIEVIIGAVAVIFVAQKWLGRKDDTPRPDHRVKGFICGAGAGFTSFIAHAGGPPLQVYLLPLRMDKTLYVGTTIVFFAVVNYVKLIPYAYLGQFTTANLLTAAVLAPVAVGGVYLGMWLHNRLNDTLFYKITYALTFLVGLKLLFDGSMRYARVFGWVT